MVKKIPLVSYLCCAFKKKQPPNPVDEAAKREDISDFSTSGGGDATQIPEDAITKPLSASGAESPENQHTARPTPNDQQQPLPPPPGGHPMRAASCQHQHQRSNSAASKLVSSMSMRVLGSGGSGRQSSRREGKPRNRDKKMKQEDSIWKKTIILGEKCKVPEEDDDSILYDENGHRISTYHRKSQSGVLSFSRQTSCIDQEELSRK
ncbi:hypothetical protein Pfo_024773 [Paulownia fortunei]|nr:hypothetical protein Pfo_024773 [Paulownia fortunei]